MSAIGRKCSVVNLDPANDRTTYPCALDVRELVTLEEIMSEDTLGPNGGVLYALEEVENNMDWLTEGLKGLGGNFTFPLCCCRWYNMLEGMGRGIWMGICRLKDIWINADDYVLFDCPGQVELFTHHSALRNIFFQIQKLGYRVCSHPPPFLRRSWSDADCVYSW